MAALKARSEAVEARLKAAEAVNKELDRKIAEHDRVLKYMLEAKEFNAFYGEIRWLGRYYGKQVSVRVRQLTGVRVPVLNLPDAEMKMPPPKGYK